MKQHHFPLLLTALSLLLTAAPLGAQSVESGTATTLPWSGWWWPAQTGLLVLGYHRGDPGPLVKQDQITGRQASQWERSNMAHFDLTGPDWWGHCHAWAAASVLEPEPRRDVYDGGILFHVGDIKGLLSEAHYSDQATFYGQRYNGNAGDDLEDMYPFAMWEVLRQYIQQNRLPVIFDLNPGPQVWSYPAYSYQMSLQPIDAGTYQQAVVAAAPLELRPGAGIGSSGIQFYQGQINLSVANFEVYPDTIGTVPQQHTYTFVFQAQGSELIANSDHWAGASVQDHPDFAYYPTQRVQQNPGLDYNLASQLDQQAR